MEQKMATNKPTLEDALYLVQTMLHFWGQPMLQLLVDKLDLRRLSLVS